MLASSALQVQPSRIRKIAEVAMTMPGVIPLYFGESNLPTPELIKTAAADALREGHTYYTSNAGLPSLRGAIAQKYEELHGVSLDGLRQVVITASGVQALNVGIRCLLDPGDEALVLTPNWPNGAAIVQMCNAVPVEVPHVVQGDRFGIDFDRLEAAVTPRTRMLLYTSPSNPLGWVATDEEQTQLLEFARRHSIWLMADEVYERLNYSDNSATPAPTILKKASGEDKVIVIQSFSKAYCMTGWRVGWLVSTRAELCERAAIFNEFTVIHAASFIQKAAEAALERGEDAVRSMVAQYRLNRDYVMKQLRALPGVAVPQPEGAFYVFPRISGLTDSFEFCRQMLLETRVGIAPGSAFGAGGEGSVRICYASERAILEHAFDRIRPFMERWSETAASGTKAG